MIDILLIDDDLLTCDTINHLISFAKLPINVKSITNKNGFLNTNLNKYEIIILSIDIVFLDPFDLIASHPSKYICLSEYNYFKNAQRLIRLGAKDFILKPIDNLEFLEAIERLIAYKFTGDSIIDEILLDISQNYEKKISLSNYAESYYMRDSNLSRLFKKRTGISFTDYIWTLRLKEAKKLILSTEMKITDIIEKVCPYSKSAFYKKFMQVYKTSPKKFKNDIKNE